MMGPATATQLARRFGESSGATSYHLRMLARHGFIEADPDHPGARDRWWRAIPETIELNSDGAKNDPTTRDALRIITSEIHQQAQEHRQRWLDEQERWSDAWQNAAEDSVLIARLDAAEAMNLSRELEELIGRYQGRAEGEGRRTVEIQLSLFPLGQPE